MKDAIGSYFNLTLLMIFILFVTGFIAVAVNYTKAYRVKNNVLNLIEKYEGKMENSDMLERTGKYISSVGYGASNSAISAAESSGYTCPEYNGKKLGWCYADRRYNGDRTLFTVDIVVFVNVNIPLINQVFSNIKFFWMGGTTNQIPVL